NQKGVPHPFGFGRCALGASDTLGAAQSVSASLRRCPKFGAASKVPRALRAIRRLGIWFAVHPVFHTLPEGDGANRTEQAISVGEGMRCIRSKAAAQIVGESLAWCRTIIGACASAARRARPAFSREQRRTMCA